MKTNDRPPKPAIYLFLLATQIFGTLIILLTTRRGVVLMGCLFALFCTSLEVERLGQAFEGNRN
jgi:hypothetical protein